MCILLMAVGFSLPAFAEDRITRPEQIPTAREEAMVPVKSRGVIIADYQALKADFPQLRSLSNRQIDEWLAGAISHLNEAQVANGGAVSTEVPIASDVPSVSGYRLPGGGRVHVFLAPGGRMIEGKGTGHITPDHQYNGLISAASAVREYLYERLLRMVLEHAGIKKDVVRTYGVVDGGFELKLVNGDTDVAGFEARAPYCRDGSGCIWGPEAVKLEGTLRRYGLTSYKEGNQNIGTNTLDRSNVQITKGGSLIDIGDYGVATEFSGSPVQPDPNLQIPFEEWGFHDGQDQIIAEARVLINGLRNGTKTRQDIDRWADSKLETVRRKLAGATPCVVRYEAASTEAFALH